MLRRAQPYLMVAILYLAVAVAITLLLELLK